ncbi:hypothetical protein [Candidatus Neoehrlichia procyonis]|nr:hypothetical protein [Candidatus Neoehrlichia lotoris]
MLSILLYCIYNTQRYEIIIVSVLLGIGVLLFVLSCCARQRNNTVKNKKKCQDTICKIKDMELRIFFIKSQVEDHFTFFSYLYSAIHVDESLYMTRKCVLQKDVNYILFKRVIIISVLLLIALLKYFIATEMLKNYIRELFITYNILLFICIIIGLSELVFNLDNILRTNSKEKKKYDDQYKLLSKQLLVIEKDYKRLMSNINCYNQEFNNCKNKLGFRLNGKQDQIKQNILLYELQHR